MRRAIASGKGALSGEIARFLFLERALRLCYYIEKDAIINPPKKRMPKINILTEATANRIAAGEVIERPSSVVKELVENSIDAGARKISVELEAGGKRMLRVTDDGCGMSYDDALLCLERHATSKIKSAADLYSITTLGFRGEAIPSVAAVSKMEIVTRAADGIAGTRVAVEGGVVRGVGETGAAPGTRMAVVGGCGGIGNAGGFFGGNGWPVDCRQEKICRGQRADGDHYQAGRWSGR